jgi:hypothetical protein
VDLLLPLFDAGSKALNPTDYREESAMSRKNASLLIVEDDRALQKQIRWAFDQYETLTADDRESALQLVRRFISRRW